MHQPVSSPSSGLPSPYTTPQHRPQHHSSPHQSPYMHQSLSPPSLGPLAPYPTPQHQPQRHFSPHQSPRYEGQHSQYQVPSNMTLPASLLSSTSVFQSMPPRPHPTPHTRSHSINGPNPILHGSQPTNQQSNQRSVPNSPQRFMMLPPQTASAMSSTHKSSSNSKATNGAGPKRRSSSNAKATDPETRERLRKVSHSAIERRRRERINDKILQLKHLVPSCVEEDHLHKLSILQSTIEYIQYLKSVIPEDVANVTLNRATNDNPNNKTTDMLEALSGSSPAVSFAPMMTTGLGHPYSRRARADQTALTNQDRNHHSASQLRTKEPRHYSEKELLSDEDAKDGLLLLSQLSSGPKLSRSGLATKEDGRYIAQDESDSNNRTGQGTEKTLIERDHMDRDEGEEDYDDEDDILHDEYAPSEDSDDEDYNDDRMTEGDEIPPKNERTTSSKMSVDLLCN
ncbi:hypothetical protein BG011_005927 [Mortierella polycephala]|uniref:BHLH domain-containing protein n=1 Tax=Mortierella polycephala TaxID=41804 RepID=A0A9P6PWT1_9FUNG|nr:hypothetical protein BG011_005927 [Mortierella polycephala]